MPLVAPERQLDVASLEGGVGEFPFRGYVCHRCRTQCFLSITRIYPQEPKPVEPLKPAEQDLLKDIAGILQRALLLESSTKAPMPRFAAETLLGLCAEAQRCAIELAAPGLTLVRRRALEENMRRFGEILCKFGSEDKGKV